MENVLEYNGYHGSVEYSSDDHVLFGKILGIRDLVTYEGISVEQLEHEFREAVDDYLKSCKELGKEPEKEFKGSFNVRVKPKIHQMATVKAQALDISLNQYVELVVENDLLSEFGVEYKSKAESNHKKKIEKKLKRNI